MVWLLVITVMSVGGMLYIKNARRPQTVVLRTQTLSCSPLQETVSCKGRVEETQETEVLAFMECVVGEVVVEDGQQVCKGDVLFTVDKEATLSVMASIDGAAAVKSAMQNTLDTSVTAPCDGIVSGLSVAKGSLLQSEQVCAVISAVEPVQIRLSVPERNIARVKVGQRVNISGIGFEKEGYSGHISEIASTAKQEMNGTTTETTVEAVVLLEEGEVDDSLRVGLTAKGAVTVSTVPTGFTIPYEAVVVDEEDREFVYVLKGETVQKRYFSPAAELVNGYLVTENFENRELLVMEPEKITGNSVYRQKETTDA